MFIFIPIHFFWKGRYLFSIDIGQIAIITGVFAGIVLGFRIQKLIKYLKSKSKSNSAQSKRLRAGSDGTILILDTENCPITKGTFLIIHNKLKNLVLNYLGFKENGRSITITRELLCFLVANIQFSAISLITPNLQVIVQRETVYGVVHLFGYGMGAGVGIVAGVFLAVGQVAAFWPVGLISLLIFGATTLYPVPHTVGPQSLVPLRTIEEVQQVLQPSLDNRREVLVTSETDGLPEKIKYDPACEFKRSILNSPRKCNIKTLDGTMKFQLNEMNILTIDEIYGAKWYRNGKDINWNGNKQEPQDHLRIRNDQKKNAIADSTKSMNVCNEVDDGDCLNGSNGNEKQKIPVSNNDYTHFYDL